MTTKKLTRRQICWSKFLSRFNFIIYYTIEKNNAKTDILIYWPNNSHANNYNDWQKFLLKTIFLLEKWEISFIDIVKSYIAPKNLIQVNLIESYYMKLQKIIKTSFLINSIKTFLFSNLIIDTYNCIFLYNHF